MSQDIHCQKCHKKNIIFREGNAICKECGNEVTVEKYFADYMASGILAQNYDGLERTEWLERIATLYLSVTTFPDSKKNDIDEE